MKRLRIPYTPAEKDALSQLKPFLPWTVFDLSALLDLDLA